VRRSEKDRLRQEADQSRQRLVATVGELSTAARATKDEAVATAKRYAPIAGSAFAGLVLLRVLGRRRRRS
jgi:hypothetical protein